MPVNFDIRFNKLHSLIRGEVNGGVRFFVTALCAAVVWISVAGLNGMAKRAESTLVQQQQRHSALARLAAEYRALAPERREGADPADTMMAFTQVSTQIALGDRVNRIVPMPDGKRLSIEVTRIYAEELTDMIRELALRGIRVISAEISALPAGEERLFSMNAVIGPEA
jgi:hypothetical protein